MHGRWRGSLALLSGVLGYPAWAAEPEPNSNADSAAAAAFPALPETANCCAPDAAEPEQSLPGAMLTLQVDASARDCPTARELADAIRVQLRVHRELNPTLRLAVRITHEYADYVGRVSVQGRQIGERVLNVPGADCTGLRDALVVTLALVLDEEAAPRASPSPEYARTVSNPSSSTRRVRDEPALAFGVRAGITQGLPLGISGVLGAELEFSRAAWSTALGAFWTPTRHVPFGPGTVDIQLLGGRARLCRFLGHDGTETLTTSLCAEGLLWQLQGRGRGYTAEQLQLRPWPALGASASMGSRGHSVVDWAVRALILFPLRRDGFGITGVPGTAYNVPGISLGIETVLSWRIL